MSAYPPPIRIVTSDSERLLADWDRSPWQPIYGDRIQIDAMDWQVVRRRWVTRSHGVKPDRLYVYVQQMPPGEAT